MASEVPDLDSAEADSDKIYKIVENFTLHEIPEVQRQKQIREKVIPVMKRFIHDSEQLRELVQMIEYDLDYVKRGKLGTDRRLEHQNQLLANLKMILRDAFDEHSVMQSARDARPSYETPSTETPRRPSMRTVTGRGRQVPTLLDSYHQAFGPGGIRADYKTHQGQQPSVEQQNAVIHLAQFFSPNVDRFRDAQQTIEHHQNNLKQIIDVEITNWK